jgi:oligosaccharide repeat unit polymerase
MKSPMEASNPAQASRPFPPLIAGGVLVAALAAQVLLLNAFTRSNQYLISSESFLLVGLGAAVWAVVHRQSLLHDPMYLAVLSYVVFIGIGPLLGALCGLPLEVTASPETAVFSWLGLAALGGGYWFARPLLADRKRRRDATPELRWQRLKLAGIACTAVGLATLVIYLYSVGGTDYLLYASYATRGGVSGYYSTPFGLLRPGFFLLLVYAMARKKVPLKWSLALVAYCLLDLLWFGPVRGSRHQIITFVLTTIYLVKESRAWRARPRLRAIPALWVVAVGLALVFVWGGLRFYSFTEITQDRERLDVSQNLQTAAFISLYTPYDTFARIVDATPNFLPFLQGSSFYESLTVLIPRDVWPSKPQPLGDWLSITLYGVLPTVGNTVPTWPGECYLNFGLPGLLAGMFGMGALCAWLARWRRAAGGGPSDSTGRILLYGVTFPLILDMMHEGSNGLVWFLFTNTAPVCAAIWLASLPGMRTRVKRFLPADSGGRSEAFAHL